MSRQRQSAFTLIELLVVVGLIAILMALVVPTFNAIRGAGGMTAAINDVASALELARAEAMATRSYVYIGFANTTNSDGNSELRVGTVISIDGSSDTTPANLRPISKLAKLANVQMRRYSELPRNVQAATDISLREDDDYVSTFTGTAYLSDKFNDAAFDSCPTLGVSPEGEILHLSNPLVFFRTTSAVGLVRTRGTTLSTSEGAIVSYSGGTGQVRVTRPQ